MRFAPDDERITRAIDRARLTWEAAYGVGIPRELVRAIIVREAAVPGSRPLRVDTLATRREPDGRTSYGLMQVLDTTAKDLGLKGDPKALYIPEVGISYGVKYLGRQLRRYAGDLEKAVAAYNAGTARKRSDGRFTNQSYVDFVFNAFRGFAAKAVEIVTSLPPSAGVAIFFAALGLYLLARKRGL